MKNAFEVSGSSPGITHVAICPSSGKRYFQSEEHSTAFETSNREKSDLAKQYAKNLAVNPAPSPEPLLVPLKEAARLLGVRVFSIRKLCRQGALPHRLIGNRWCIPTAALRAFAAGEPTRKGVRA